MVLNAKASHPTRRVGNHPDLAVRSAAKRSNLRQSTTPSMSQVPSFPISLKLGWIANILGWAVFIITMDHTVEFIVAVVALVCAYTGHKHMQLGTAPAFGRLSASQLRAASAFEAVWMLMWALEIW